MKEEEAALGCTGRAWLHLLLSAPINPQKDRGGSRPVVILSSAWVSAEC